MPVASSMDLVVMEELVLKKAKRTNDAYNYANNALNKLLGCL